MIDFNALIEKHLKVKFKPKKAGRYYPSEIGSCIRKIWYSYMFPKETDAELMKIFKAGTMIHDFVAEVLGSERTPEVKLLKTEVPFSMDFGDFTVSGRVDDILLLSVNNKKLLVEVKSVRFVDRAEPTRPHIMQLQMYMHALGIHSGFILYIERNSLHSKTFRVDYDPGIIGDIIQRFQMLHESLTSNRLPAPEARENPEIGWMCNYCNYREECSRDCKQAASSQEEHLPA